MIRMGTLTDLGSLTLLSSASVKIMADASWRPHQVAQRGKEQIEMAWM